MKPTKRRGNLKKRSRKVVKVRVDENTTRKPSPEWAHQTAVAAKRLKRDIEGMLLGISPKPTPFIVGIGDEPVTSVTRIEGDPRALAEVAQQQTMPEGSATRKGVPLCTGVLDYFPAALAAVARLSKFGNDKHNPGQPLHWARGKSSDHADCILRHLADRGVPDPETGMSHTVEVAWRALALLQEEEERLRGAAKPRGAY